MAVETDSQINARLVEIRDETAPNGNTTTRIYNAFKNIYDTIVGLIATISGTRGPSFGIQINSQNQDTEGITVLALYGGQGSGLDIAIANIWDAVAETMALKVCYGYTGTGSDVWENIGSSVTIDDGSGRSDATYSGEYIDGQYAQLTGDIADSASTGTSNSTLIDALTTRVEDLEGFQVRRPTKTITGNYTIDPIDNGYNILYDSASPGLITVPNSLAGSDIAFFQVNTGTFEFQAGSGATLENFGSKFKSAGQKAIVTVVSYQGTGTVVWHPNGDLVA